MVATADARPLPSPTSAVVARCVFVAEDDAEMRALITAALEADGYAVVAASDGRDLLARLETDRERVGVIVSDVRMPGYSGLDLLAIVRCASWAVPVILITAFGDEETHAEARELGAVTVLDKPFDLDDLRAAVRSAAPPR